MPYSCTHIRQQWALTGYNVDLNVFVVCSIVILITLSLAVYGAAASIQMGVLVVGGEGMFDWAYYVSLGGVVVALLAAILFLIEGQRGPGDNDGDGEETAKMV